MLWGHHIANSKGTVQIIVTHLSSVSKARYTVSLIHTGTRTCTLNGKARLHTLTEPGLLTESSQDDGDSPPRLLGAPKDQE